MKLVHRWVLKSDEIHDIGPNQNRSASILLPCMRTQKFEIALTDVTILLYATTAVEMAIKQCVYKSVV